MNWRKRLIVEPGKQIHLKRYDPADTLGIDSEDEIKDEQAESLKDLEHLQEKLYAEHKRALLIVLQGMDASGKDGTVKHVMSGVNPQGCSVTSFKQPAGAELDHDYLWRIHQAVPAAGKIGLFNRSHYEDVLVVRVHDLVPAKIWGRRYEQINNFEDMLTHNGVHILKFFLHISREEQGRRFHERQADAKKNWKFNPGDLTERKFWDSYVEAYEDALTRCSTKRAPWFIIPADHKWVRNLAISSIIVDELKSMKIVYPENQ